MGDETGFRESSRRICVLVHGIVLVGVFVGKEDHSERCRSALSAVSGALTDIWVRI